MAGLNPKEYVNKMKFSATRLLQRHMDPPPFESTWDKFVLSANKWLTRQGRKEYDKVDLANMRGGRGSATDKILDDLGHKGCRVGDLIDILQDAEMDDILEAEEFKLLTDHEPPSKADFKQTLEKALARGYAEVKIVKCVTLGPPEAGKTQAKSALVGRFDRSNESTPMSTGAEVVMERYISRKTSWEPITRGKLTEILHRTVQEISPSISGSTHISSSQSDALMREGLQVEMNATTSSSQQYVSTNTISNAQREKEVLQMKFHELKRSVEEDLMESDGATLTDGMSLQRFRIVHLIDSGGQPAFFDIHPVIATSRAVYLLVYNMDEGLEAKPNITYRKKDFPTKDMPNEKQTNLDMIIGSLITIHHCKQKFAKMDKELRHWFRESISESVDAVPVLIAGTRKKVESIGSESKKLAAGCSHLPSWKEVLPCTLNGTRLFPVDSMDPTCEGVQALRDAITEAESTYQLRLPISWLFCQLIFLSADKNLQTIPFSDLRDLCQHENLVSDHHEFLAMIRTFHLLGIISFPHFDQEKVLDDQWNPDAYPVFTNPDVLYQQVTKILEVVFRRLEITKMKPRTRRNLEALQSNGKLNVHTLSHLGIPDQLGSYTGFHSYLLELLVQWRLAARLASKASAGNADGGATFECFIPSVFPVYNQKSFHFLECPIHCLAFTFLASLQDGRTFYHVPQGIFPHLIVNLLTMFKAYRIQHNTDSYKCLFRDAAIFVIKPSLCSTMEHSYSVVVTDVMDHISISIYPSHVELRESDRDCHQIIRDFKSAVNSAYEQMYCTVHPVTLACPCPCGRIQKCHLAAIVPCIGTPARYNQECLSSECPNWVQDCPEDIAAILSQAAPEVLVSGCKRPPVHEESLPTKRKDDKEATMTEGGSMAPVYNPTHFSQPTVLPPPSPPSGGATTAVPLPATNELATSTVAHPADMVKALRHQVDAKWRHFGTFLYVESTLLDAIERDSRGSTDCMLDLVTKWVTGYDGTGDLPRTWQTVVDAVRDSGFRQLALELAGKHGITLTQQ